MKRYEMYVCECALGAHADTREDEDGSWVKAGDAEALEARVAELENALRFCWDQGIHPMCVPTVETLLKPQLSMFNLSEIRQRDHESGDFGKALDGYAGQAATLETRVAELEAWKESALAVLNGIDLQSVGKELGLKPGADIGPAILPGIRALKSKGALCML